MAVGSPGSRLNGVDGVGAVYVFDLSSIQAEPVELRPQQSIAQSAYGTSLTGSSTVIAIGAPGGSAVANDPTPAGVVETWRLVDNWSRYGTISVPMGYAGTNFARSISYSTQKLAVGFPGRIDNGVPSGAVFQFNELGGAWSFLGAISLPFRDFGETVFAAGANILVTSPLNRSVYYSLGGLGTLPDPPPDQGVMVSYGTSLWANNNVLVGTPYPVDNGGNPLPGRVFSYRRANDGIGYTLIDTITAPDAVPGDGFGSSIDNWAGGSYAIGAPSASVEDIEEAGSVWIFRTVGADLVPQQRVTSTRPQPQGNFGASVSWIYGRLGIGAPGESIDGLERAGGAYVFGSDADVIFKGSFDFQ